MGIEPAVQTPGVLDSPLSNESMPVPRQPRAAQTLSTTLFVVRGARKMIRSRLGLFGTCIAVLCTFAFAAGGAQAESGANWSILNSSGEFKTGAELKASVTGWMEGFGSLLTEVLGIQTEVSCTTASPIGMSLEGNGSLTNGSKVEFGGCSTRLNGFTNAECKPKAGGAFVGTILTNSMKGLLVLFLGQGYVRFEPASGETLATLNLGPECPIGELLPVRGKVYLEDSELKTWKETHLVRESLWTDLWVLNKTAEHDATLDGSGEAWLSFSHVGLIWSGQPA
jgi:hypothetical protein